MNIPRHKVFMSYYHAEDQNYKDMLLDANERLYLFKDCSVLEREIVDDNMSSEQIRRIIRDDYMREATVLLLLCGQNTKRRKHIDWEIHTAMYHSDVNPQMGIVILNLPTIRQNQLSICNEDKQFFGNGVNWTTLSRNRNDLISDYPYLPSRIVDNIETNGNSIPVVNWSTIENNVQNLVGIIDVAFKRRHDSAYNHSAPLRRNNS